MFNLQLAVTLAGAAFESYNEPVGAVLNTERTVNNTETTYVSRCKSALVVLCTALPPLHIPHGPGIWPTETALLGSKNGPCHGRPLLL